MGVRRALPDPDGPRGAAARPRAARGVRRLALDRAGGRALRLLPTNFPPWPAVYQQTRRWLAAGCFEAVVHDLRCALRLAQGRAADPTAVIFDARTLRSSPESGARAGYDGHKRKRGSKLHLAVDTLGHLLALRVTPANAQERAQVGALAAAVQEATGERVEVASVDQAYTGEEPAAEAAAVGIRLEVVKLPQAKHGSALLPKRWVVETTLPDCPRTGTLCPNPGAPPTRAGRPAAAGWRGGAAAHAAGAGGRSQPTMRRSPVSAVPPRQSWSRRPTAGRRCRRPTERGCCGC